ncbi:MAG: nucleotide exchange factor GrpE [Candidatus Omnitrophica bacterium]|nr:nucleotide exchange factor GrpE [Candidatus Omnitrophota bacterium]
MDDENENMNNSEQVPFDSPETTDKADGEVKMASIPSEEYERLLSEAAEYKDRNVRLVAEFDNARKRWERERIDFRKFANEGLIIEFLDILDDLERTVAVAQAKHEDYEAFLKGVELVMGQINKMLSQHGVKPLEAKGKKFDPHSQEVLYQEPNDAVEEGTVLEELQKGYCLGDRVIRTAKVKLAKSK